MSLTLDGFTSPWHLLNSIKNEPEIPQDNDDQEFVVEDNDAFYEAYIAQEGEVMSQAMEDFLSSTEFDPNYEEGEFFLEATRRKDVEFLRKLVTASFYSPTCEDSLFEALKITLLNKDIETMTVLDGLSVSGENLKKIQRYYGAGCSQEIQHHINSLIAKRQIEEATKKTAVRV